jgi:hypothetical protein
VQDVDLSFIDNLEKLCKKNSGKASIRFYLKDDESSLQTELLSRTSQIKPNNILIKELKKMGDVGVVTDKLEVRWLGDQLTKLAAPKSDEVGTISSTFVLEPIES